jgi:hypothetical protein
VAVRRRKVIFDFFEKKFQFGSGLAYVTSSWKKWSWGPEKDPDLSYFLIKWMVAKTRFSSLVKTETFWTYEIAKA